MYTPDTPLDCTIAAYGEGDDPDVTEGQLRGWRTQTRAAFSMRLFPGDHFFLHSARRPILRAVSEHLVAALIREGENARVRWQ